MDGKQKWRWLAVGGVCALAGVWGFLGGRHETRIEVLSLIVPHSVAADLVFVAQRRHYFEDEGLTVAVSELPFSADGLERVMAGDAHFAVVSETPLVRAAFENQDFHILATVFSTSSDVKIIARRDHGIVSAEDLRGKKVGAPQGTGPEFYLASFLLQFGLGLNDVQLVNKNAQDLVGELKAGKLDALAVSQSGAVSAAKQLGTRGVVLPEGSLYRESYNLVVSGAWLKGHSAETLATLRALEKSEQYLFAHREEADVMLARRLHLDRDGLEEARREGQWALRLDQGLLVSLEEKARWLQDRKVVPAGKIPNFLTRMHVQGLATVKPSGVGLIH